MGKGKIPFIFCLCLPHQYPFVRVIYVEAINKLRCKLPNSSKIEPTNCLIAYSCFLFFSPIRTISFCILLRQWRRLFWILSLFWRVNQDDYWWMLFLTIKFYLNLETSSVIDRVATMQLFSTDFHFIISTTGQTIKSDSES